MSQDLLEHLTELAGKATPPKGYKVASYDHGGGRVYLESDEGRRKLLADFYHYDEREYWIAAANACPTLVAAVLKLSEALERIEKNPTAWGTASVALAEVRSLLQRGAG